MNLAFFLEERSLAKITRNAYQKIAGSKAIGPNLALSGNASRSFQVFLKALRQLAAASA